MTTFRMLKGILDALVACTDSGYAIGSVKILFMGKYLIDIMRFPIVCVCIRRDVLQSYYFHADE